MQIVLGILVLVVFATLFAGQFEKISHQTKIQILKTVAFVFALAWMYQSFVSSSDAHKRTLINAFQQEKTLLCDKQPVTTKFFYFESGTESFVTNDKNASLNGVVYPIGDCEMKEGS